MPSGRSIPNLVPLHEATYDHSSLTSGDANATYYVDASLGDDTNAGTIGAPFATIGRALEEVPATNEAVITINIAAGSYAESNTIQFRTQTGNGRVLLVGAAQADTGSTATISSIVADTYGRQVQLNRSLIAGEVGAKCVFTDGNRSGTAFYILHGTVGSADVFVSYNMLSTTSRAFKVVAPVVSWGYAGTKDTLLTVDVINGVPFSSAKTVALSNITFVTGLFDEYAIEVYNGYTSITNCIIQGDAVAVYSMNIDSAVEMTYVGVSNCGTLYGSDTSNKSNIGIYYCSIDAVVTFCGRGEVTFSACSIYGMHTYVVRGQCVYLESGMYKYGTDAVVESQYGYLHNLTLTSGTYHGMSDIVLVQNVARFTNLAISGGFLKPTSHAYRLLSDNCSAVCSTANITVVNPTVPMFSIYTAAGDMRNSAIFTSNIYSAATLVAYSPTDPPADISTPGAATYTDAAVLNVVLKTA